MSEKGQDKNKGKRLFWLDNLRTFLIFLVVLGHAAVVYEKYSMGSEWWIVVDPAGNDLPGIVFLILNIFIIATIFFVSGFFAPLSLKNKNGLAFLRSKFKRLMIPWIVAVFTLIPIYKVIFLYSRNLPQENWTTYFHWNALWSQNWLWFLPVLFLFEMLYFGFSKLKMKTPSVSFKNAILTLLIASVLYGFCMDFFGLHGWTKTVLIDFQNERILIYFMAFLLGSLCYKLEVFENEWKNKKLDLALHCTGWIPINLYIFLLIYALAKPSDYLISKAADTLALRLNFVLGLAYLLYALITNFKKYLNKQGKIGKELSDNSYNVYIIHVVIMGGIALTMLDTSIPSPVKFLVLTVATYAVSNLIVSSYRKVIPKKRLT